MRMALSAYKPEIPSQGRVWVRRLQVQKPVVSPQGTCRLTFSPEEAKIAKLKKNQLPQASLLYQLCWTGNLA